MGLELDYKVDVAAIFIKMFSKFPLSPLQNALEHCHDSQESVSIALMKQKHQSAEFFKNGINGWKHCLEK